ncbi:MAG: MBL fold metallo-hydrolase [Candidatus Omnitrophica bacterium]|nr:MBL fold metallo-hydrolase [Candidatus Omnitrophota bacterium]
MILETIEVGSMQVNCYVLAEDKGRQAILIDPGGDALEIKKILDRHGLKPAIIINTHGHIDHIGADNEFNVPVYVHRLDAELLRNPELNLSVWMGESFTVSNEIKVVEDNEMIESAGLSLRVLHTPGHTPGGMCLVLTKPDDTIVFSGDSLFSRSIGRSDLPNGDGRLLVKSIRDKLFSLDDAVRVYPGHGPFSTIGEEKRENPYLGEK